MFLLHNFKELEITRSFGKHDPSSGGGPRLSEISCTYDPPIYDITSGCRVAALFSREAQRWTPDAIGFLVVFTHRLTELCILNAENVEKVSSRPLKQMS